LPQGTVDRQTSKAQKRPAQDSFDLHGVPLPFAYDLSLWTGRPHRHSGVRERRANSTGNRFSPQQTRRLPSLTVRFCFNPPTIRDILAVRPRNLSSI